MYDCPVRVFYTEIADIVWRSINVQYQIKSGWVRENKKSYNNNKLPIRTYIHKTLNIHSILRYIFFSIIFFIPSRCWYSFIHFFLLLYNSFSHFHDEKRFFISYISASTQMHTRMKMNFGGGDWIFYIIFLTLDCINKYVLYRIFFTFLSKHSRWH
jgi:hypothetical protein